MEERIAIVGIIVENRDEIEKVQEILHDYGNYILGRMGIPRVEENVNVITIVLKAPQEEIAALSGKLGNLENITAKTIYKKV